MFGVSSLCSCNVIGYCGVFVETWMLVYVSVGDEWMMSMKTDTPLGRSAWAGGNCWHRTFMYIVKGAFVSSSAAISSSRSNQRITIHYDFTMFFVIVNGISRHSINSHSFRLERN
jgi:hypothetical protein